MYNDYSAIGHLVGSVVAFSFLWSIAAWFACAGFAAYLASEKGRCGICWFMWGAIFGPLALLATVGLPVIGSAQAVSAESAAHAGATRAAAGGYVAGVVKKPGAGLSLMLIALVVAAAYFVGR